MRRVGRGTALAALVGAAVLALAGCAGALGDDPAATNAEQITITDAWIKAADEGMTAGFGIVGNNTADDVVLIAADSPAAGMIELHETVSSGGQMMMQEVGAGFEIPAGSERVLEPGADHLMFMSLTEPLRAGDEVTLTLRFSNGSEVELVAPVKDYSGANENYAPGHDHDHDGHDHDHSDGTGDHDGHGQ